MLVLGLVDSFKGTLSSIDIGKILVSEFNKKNIKLDYFPISDGGEGFLDTINFIKKLDKKYVNIVDPLFRKMKSYYYYDKNTSTAYIELAKTAGIGLLKKEEYNPLITSTYGAGLCILDAINSNIENIILGIGGTCTNDGGSGLLEALGVKFYDIDKNIISNMCNRKLGYVCSIDINDFNEKIINHKFIVINDVTNELLGQNGATYVFSPQKGAKLDDLPILEDNLTNYARIVENVAEGIFSKMPGSGAAGGVGFTMLSLFKAKLIKGIDYTLDLINFDNIKNRYNYIITGEGKIDEQSLSGKVIFEIVQRASKVKVILVSGKVEISKKILDKFGVYKSYEVVGNIASLEESLRKPKKYFRKLVKQIELDYE